MLLYRDFNSYLREKFGCRVQKITVDAGLSCPNRDGSIGTGGCIYCNSKGSGTGAAMQELSISQQLLNAKSFLARRYKAKKFLAYFQSFTNTYAPLPKLKSLYEEALAVPDVVGLTIGTRPDCISDPILDYIKEISSKALIWMEYGLQSAQDQTLKLINRNHSIKDFENAVKKTRLRNLPICVHVILGLPGESRKDMMSTARFLSSLDIQAIKIHLLYVVKGTVLDQWYKSGKYRCLKREEYISLVGEFLTYLPSHMIIQRLTGDPHRDELVAPDWALEKHKNLEAIHNYMKEHSLYQGKAYPSSFL